MEDFVVSARKYRPTTFEAVVGQSHITTTLKNAIINNHLAQAFLFCGPRGVGKTTCARILAKTINCQQLTEAGEACGICDSCRSFQNNASLNIHELDAASNNSVEDIRHLVDQVRYPPQSGKYKIYIIDEVHMLSNAAFNAFLKTLEEPPSYAIFILATTEKHKIIPTILSRCQIFDFNRIQIQDITRHLAKIAAQEQVKASPEALHLIAEKAEGGLRDALSMFDILVTFSTDRTITYEQTIENLHILDYDYYFRMTEALLEEEVSQALLIFNEILKKGFDGHQFIVGLSSHLRNLLVAKDPQTTTLLTVTEAVKERYLVQSQKITRSLLVTAMNLASLCDLHYKTSKNQRLHVELTLIKMAYIQRTIQLAEFPQEEAQKKKPNAVEGKSTVYTKNFFKTTVKIPSKQILEENVTYKEEKVSEILPKTVEEVNVMEVAPSSISEEEVKNAWSALAAHYQEDIKQYIILNRDFTWKAPTIHLALTNPIQMDNFQTLKPTWLQYLRAQLNHSTIQIEATLAKPTQENTKPYTARDKLKYLVKKNKHLITLQQRFGLDLDG
ncbi:MAG: DNA polymerase III subunit gamma/tau [Bacteroidota bacterium]